MTPRWLLAAPLVLCAAFGACGGGGAATTTGTASPPPTLPPTATRTVTAPTRTATATPRLTATIPPAATATPDMARTPAPAVEPLDATMPGRELALRFVPAGAREVSFTDWTALKAYEGAHALTGASPFEEKTPFLASLGRAQWPASFYAGKKLKVHFTAWSWDTLDLDWEASFSAGGAAFVLKFPEGFDLGPVVAHFVEHRYAKDDYRGVPLYTHALDAKDEWVRTSEFAILNVGVLEQQNILLLATRADGVKAMIDAVGGAGDRERYRPAVAALGDVAAYTLGPVPSVCPFGALPPAVAPAPYDVAGLGYRYDAGVASASIVLGYDSATDAEAASEAIVAGADRGNSLRTKKPYAEVAFSVDDSEVVGPVVAIRVTPVDGLPSKVMQLIQSRDLGFAPCPAGS